jgi:hypothetical protein
VSPVYCYGSGGQDSDSMDHLSIAMASDGQG